MDSRIKESVYYAILQYIEGNREETNKFEVKREWFKLKDKKGKNEFLKDICACVNSYGFEDSFIIIGIDEESKKVYAADISDSGYSDPADIRNIINSNIEPPIRIDIDTIFIESVKINVLHLLPSTQKPHYVLKYYGKGTECFENEVFIRSGASALVANRHDIDRMYFERTNLVLERRLELSINVADFRVIKSDDGFWFQHPFTIENTGTRIVAIARVEIELYYGDTEDASFRNIHFFSRQFAYQNLIIKSGELVNRHILFNTLFDDHEYYDSVMLNSQFRNVKISSCRIVLANNEVVDPIIFTHATEGDFPIDFSSVRLR